MKVIGLFLIFITGSILFSGCASNQYAVTFDSYPQGATVIGNGTNWGYTPVTLYFTRGKEEGIYISDFYAHWASGAIDDYNGAVSFQEFPNGVRITAQRPNVPGFQQDAEFALKVQQLHAQQRQAEAAEDAADAARRQANTAAWDSINRNRPVNCYTIGGRTTCY